MSNQPNQAAQDAKAPKQENLPIEKVSVPSFPEPPVLQIDVSKLNPQSLALAKSAGVDIGGILAYVSDLQAWSNGAEARLQAIVRNFDDSVKTTVKSMAAEAQKEAQARQQTQIQAYQQQQTQQPQTNLLGTLASVAQNPEAIKAVMGLIGGGGQNDLLQGLMIESFKKRMAFADAFQDTLLSKLAGKEINKLVDATDAVVKL